MLCSQVEGYLSRSSWIRRMFEAGIELKKKYGPENVYDFSLGNPDLAPPAAVAEGLRELADDACKPFAFGYMPNAGYPQVRARLAEVISGEQGTAVTADEVVVTCGAAGGINALFRAVLEPGDEVLCPAPYFVEYGFYAENHRGVLKAVPSKPLTFELDIKALAAAITERTRCVLVNSPHNPPGRNHTLDELASLPARAVPSCSFPTSPTASWPTTAPRSRRSSRSTSTAWWSAPSPRTWPWPGSGSGTWP